MDISEYIPMRIEALRKHLNDLDAERQATLVRIDELLKMTAPAEEPKPIRKPRK